MGKRRFGISIPQNLAEALDKLASRLGVSRSELVTLALREFLHDHSHYLYEHECIGVIILVGLEKQQKSVENLLESYRDIIRAYLHAHADGECIEVIIVKGYSMRILTLHRKLAEIGCKPRFIPLRNSSWSEGNNASAPYAQSA
ncbi:MAG TPA: CopG family ribbon-helix-helix protein [Pyrodictiaceae archaeon]|nr:CopG family ribbon-helix-helix protein [Pyrodictiaceae archaeon]HIQ55937.1 CopG family ribbon-helix-helix protein [Pyrodictium sp.]